MKRLKEMAIDGLLVCASIGALARVCSPRLSWWCGRCGPGPADMKLYQAPRNTRLFVPLLDREIIFHHIDGMYSYCTDDQGNAVHLAADVEVEMVGEPAHGIGVAEEATNVAGDDLTRCPSCGGPADNGFDRSIPPNPYFCTKCMAALE